MRACVHVCVRVLVRACVRVCVRACVRVCVCVLKQFWQCQVSLTVISVIMYSAPHLKSTGRLQRLTNTRI